MNPILSKVVGFDSATRTITVQLPPGPGTPAVTIGQWVHLDLDPVPPVIGCPIPDGQPSCVCRICQSPAFWNGQFHVCGANPAHIADSSTGIFSDFSFPTDST